VRKSLLFGALGAAAALVAPVRDARACGGYFPPATESGTSVSGHRMIFAVSPQQTTLYDQIEYQGSPSSFAWVLPIHGTVTVGISSDVLFEAIDQATTTTIVAPTLPTCPTCACGGEADASVGGFSSSSSSGGSGVTVFGEMVVGPYETVQLGSSDPMALTNWLTTNGYAIPDSVAPVIAEYVSEGFDFLAMRLAPGQGVQAMRPVSVTTPGAGLTLPLRMVAAGTGATPTVGITLWVVASGRYEPMNFKTFTISGSDLTWDFNAGPGGQSNYTTVQSNDEAMFGNAAWQIESSLNLSPYQIENVILQDPASQDYLPGAATAEDGGASDTGVDDDASAEDAGLGETADAVRQQDLATCFPGGNATEVRITRMRADLSQAALATDLVLQAAADQSTISNIYNVTMSVNAPVCPTIDESNCPCGVSSSGASSGGDGVTTTSSGRQSFSCSSSSNESGGGGLDLALAGLCCAAVVRSRVRSRVRRSR